MSIYLRLLRPADWIKNLFVFAALAFGDGIRDAHKDLLALLAFAAFCLTSSAGYILNDFLDRERDRQHPRKKDRPIASGAITPQTAAVIFVVLLLAAAAISFYLPVGFRLTLLGYLVLTIAYSLIFKYRVILDVLVIAVLFVLRALAGAQAIDVPVSSWLMVCTFMLCLFLGFGKRRCEIAMIGDTTAIRRHRPTLVRYTPDLLTHLLSTSGGIAIITFLLYTLDTTTHSPFMAHKQHLVYTLPLVVYGIFRYAMLIELGETTGPTDLMVRDRPFLITIVLWVLMTIGILYLGPQVF